MSVVSAPALALAFGAVLITATASARPFRHTSSSVQIDLGVSDATVCVPKLVASRAAEGRVGIDVAIADQLLNPKAEMA